MRFPKHFATICVLSAGLTGGALATEQIHLNDTGMDWCGNNEAIKLECPQATHPGQDAEFGRDLLAKQGKLEKKGGGQAGFDFTKLDQDGKPLSPEAKEWSCVLDNHTGLMWELKTDDDGLRDKDHTYTWYNEDPAINGGAPGAKDGGKCQGSRCDTTGYVKALNKQGLCGHADWRLPKMEELRSLIHYGRVGPAIDTDYFPDTLAADFWVAEAWPKRAGIDAYSINFQGGKGAYLHRDREGVHLRLVRRAP